jgi:hypothetical protein
MNIYDSYGFKTDSLEMARAWAEDVLGSMELHESSYIGEYYRLDISDNENYVLQPNYCDDDWTEEDFQSCKILLYVNDSPNADKIREKLLFNNNDSIEFIRRAIFTEDGLSRKYRFIDGKDILISEINLADFS